MDKKSKSRWKLTQLRIRSKVFLRRNGLQVMLVVSLALLGAAAVLIFTHDDNETPGQYVDQSGNQRLEDAMSGNPTAQAQATPDAKAAPGTAGENGHDMITIVPVDYPTHAPDTTIIPDFTQPPMMRTPEPETKFQPPVDGSITRIFAMNSLIYSETLNQWMTHSGVDIASPKGSEVRAIAAGTVESVYTDDMLGVTVVITHANGMVSVYSNLDEDVPVKAGDSIDERAIVGRIGSSAISECLEKSHLHFEIHIDGEPVNPAGLILFIQE